MAEHMAEWGMTSINQNYEDVRLYFGMKIPNKNPETKQLIKSNSEFTNNKEKKDIKK